MARLETIGIRFSKKELAALRKASVRDDRPISAFTRKIIVDVLKKLGHLP